MRPTLHFSVLAAALVAVAACAPDATEPARPLTLAEVRTLALHIDESSSGVVGTQASQTGLSLPLDAGVLQNASRQRTDNFSVSRTCAAGGMMTLTGQRTVTADRETLTLDLAATKSYADCPVETRQNVVISRTGAIGVRAHRSLVGGAPSGLQTQSHQGSFAWTASDGRQGTCTVDLRAEFNPATRTHTVKGTLCGRTIDVSRTLR